MKNILFFLVTGLSFGDQSPLTFYPQFSSNYFSSGSIHHTNESGYSSLSTFGLGAKKSEGPFSITGLFQYSSAQNLIHGTTFFNPDLNIEMKRDYISNDDTWFESSNLKIDYVTDSFTATFGKYNTHWGNGKSGLIVSNNVPSFPQAGFLWQMSKTLVMEYFLGSLSSKIVDTTSSDLYENVGQRNTYFPRSIAAHRIIWRPVPFLTFHAIETVIYGNRAIDIHYLLPFIPFWSMQHYTGDLDNVQMCGELIWHLNDKWEVYGSLFVDEWRPEWTFKETNRNWFGWQVGGTGKDLIQMKDQLRFEYTWTDHRIYRHRFPINDSYSYKYALGFWAGPHAEETYLSYTFPIKGIKLQSFLSHAKRGELTEQMLEDQYNNVNYTRYSNETETRTIASVLCEKGFFSNKVILKFGGEWIDWKNPGFDPLVSKSGNKDFSKISIQIGVAASTPISFD